MKELCRYSNPLQSYWTVNVTHFFLPQKKRETGGSCHHSEITITAKTTCMFDGDHCQLTVIQVKGP